DDRYQERCQGELDRGRDGRGDDVRHGGAAANGRTQVTPGRAQHVVDVLLHQRLVQAELLAVLLALLGADVLSREHHVHRVAGGDVDEGEHDDGHAEQDEDGLPEPSDDEAKHGAPHAYVLGAATGGSACERDVGDVEPTDRRGLPALDCLGHAVDLLRVQQRHPGRVVHDDLHRLGVDLLTFRLVERATAPDDELVQLRVGVPGVEGTLTRRAPEVPGEDHVGV